MAAPQRRSWASLLTASLHEILSRVPCPAVRHRVYRVCRAWRAAVDALPPPNPPRALPWLLLPTPHPGSSTRIRVACALSGFRDHHYLNIVPPGARCFGSHDGAWLFLQFREQRSHELVNVRTGHARVLPRELLRRTDPYIQNMTIHAAALSSSPEDTDYVGAAIVTSWRVPVPPDAVPRRRRCVAFWRKHSLRAYDAVPVEDGDVSLDVEDVTYSSLDQSFLFLTQGEHLLRCGLVLLQNGIMGMDWGMISLTPDGRLYDQYVRSRYLVVSRRQVLMVVRFAPQPHQPTSKFKVFRLTKRITSADADCPLTDLTQYPLAWSELDALDGRMLFVGHGCSSSYEVRQYPGFKEGIYFLDDGDFYDASVLFGNGNVRQYPCSDNGIWSEGHVQRCFPRSDPSDHSAPVWLLP